MPGTRCCIPACGNSLKKTRVSDRTISYHRFPKNDEIRKLWVEKCNRSGKWNPNTSHVCSIHFTAEDIKDNYRTKLVNIPCRQKLKYTAVPSLHLESAASMPFVINGIPRLPSYSIRNDMSVKTGQLDFTENEYSELSNEDSSSLIDNLENIDDQYLIASDNASKSRNRVSYNLMKEISVVECELRRRIKNIKELEHKIKALELELKQMAPNAIRTKVFNQYTLSNRRKSKKRRLRASVVNEAVS